MQILKRLLGFTLIELMVVIAIISILAALVLGLVAKIGGSSDRLQVSITCAHYTDAMLLYLQTSGQLPPPDDLYYIDYDPALDMNDPMQNIDSAYKNWPVTNKLIARCGLSIDHELFQDNGSGTEKRLFDLWDEEIRYVIGSGVDDNGFTVEGLFPDWNWDADKGEVIIKVYPYVYSYGPENPGGVDTALWLRKVE